jgi:shikimate dehydrogenase
MKLGLRLLNNLGILGWPLTKTFSPQIHELLFDYSGMRGSYNLIKKENIDKEIISKINQDFLGYNTTIPYKEKILSMDNTAILSKSVQEIGACNTVLNKNSKMFLFNTDFSGFKNFLDLINHSFDKKVVLILGAGGSSKSIAYCLRLLNINYHIASRTEKDKTISYNQVSKLSNDIGMVINTTPVGMPPYENSDLPIKWDELINLKTVINLGYGSQNTFLDNFDHSISRHDGLGMLICQAIESFNIWTSAGLSTSSIYGEVLNKLESRND